MSWPGVLTGHSPARPFPHLLSMTPMEGKGLLRGAGLLLTLAVLKVGLAGLRGDGSSSSPGRDELPSLIQAARESRSEEVSESAPLESGERLDPNRAPVSELIRIPGIKKGVAQALVTHREAEGAFSTARDLLEVKGIGPATLARMEPFLDLSHTPPVRPRREREGPAMVDLNRAQSEELQMLPGIGPALAGRIVQYRAREGPFGHPEDLLGISGIGPATLERIRPLLLVR